MDDKSPLKGARLTSRELSKFWAPVVASEPVKLRTLNTLKKTDWAT